MARTLRAMSHPPTPTFPPFDNSWVRELPFAGVRVSPARWPAPRLAWLNRPLAAELGIALPESMAEAAAPLFSGQQLPAGAEPFAQVYAGHQFGGFSPQLGDGRALLLGEVMDRHGQRRDIALKGSGRTPYSRGGDGLAALGPMLREVLVSESLHALGVPTTRALAVVATGQPVWRDDAALPGAVLTRVAASHLRVGSFQFFAARGQLAELEALLRHAARRHDADLADAHAHDTPALAHAVLQRVAERQARLVAQWMGLGFIHGVMNTDNMAISGETIDYGPCAFMEAVDPETVFSSIDHHGRYAYGQQPGIARWNLARLAEALLLLMSRGQTEGAAAEAALAQAGAVIDRFAALYDSAWLAVWRAKLGLRADTLHDAEDRRLAESWLRLLQEHAVDFTLAARALVPAAAGLEDPLRTLFGSEPEAITPWLALWRARLALDGSDTSAVATQLADSNPRTIARNHRVEEALAAATAGDLGPFEALLPALQNPFVDEPALARYATPAPPAQAAGYRTFCGT
jgi:serine/tyrosine/threonine adenylyltransferase